MIRIALASLLLAVTAAATPAFASDNRNGFGTQAPSSVFPAPRDPWRSWGVRSEFPDRVGPPRAERHDSDRRDWNRHEWRDGSRDYWVPAQWWWNGAAWVWWPGHWIRY